MEKINKENYNIKKQCFIFENRKQKRGKRVEDGRRREKMEHRRGKGQVWREGMPVFIGEVRYLPAFINTATLDCYFNIPAFINAVTLYYYYNTIM